MRIVLSPTLFCARSLSESQGSRTFKSMCAVSAAIVPKNIVAHWLFVLPVEHVCSISCCCSLVSSHHCFGVFGSVCFITVVFIALGLLLDSAHTKNLALATSVISGACGSLFYPCCLVLSPSAGFLHTRKPCFGN